jgi:phytoene desaturase
MAVWWDSQVAAKNIVVVGAGPGGLTAAMLLASRGFKVTVFEKAGEVGGRNAPIRLGDFKFDTGPTFLMMKFTLDDVFAASGLRTDDYFDARRLEPMYRLCFDDSETYAWNDTGRMRDEITQKFPGEEAGYDRFSAREPTRFQKVYATLARDYCSPLSMLNGTLLRALPHLAIGRSLMDEISTYFKPEKLRLSFTFGAKYLGMSPWECPGGYMIIPYVEREFGIYHVMGGLCEISAGMAKAIRQLGGEIRLNTTVKRLLLDGKAVRGVELENGEKVYADEVIVNADFAYAMTHLVEDGRLRKYSRPKLAKKRYSCSTFMLYLGLDKIYDVPHHSIVFAKDYRSNVADIFHNGRLSEDTSLYIQNPSVTDPSLAPPGKSAVYVLVPVANNASGIDWAKEKDAFQERVLDTIERRTSMKDIRQHIEQIKVITPARWEGDYNVYNGATFNLAHNLMQMLYLRPHNRFEELDNCYIVGGGTHPGSGLPTIYVSGQIAANMICAKYSVPEVPAPRVPMPVPVSR